MYSETFSVLNLKRSWHSVLACDIMKSWSAGKYAPYNVYETVYAVYSLNRAAARSLASSRSLDVARMSGITLWGLGRQTAPQIDYMQFII